ncbi:hypothetical protein Hanom_Chr04g00370831 [Helianthus anomalus]
MIIQIRFIKHPFTNQWGHFPILSALTEHNFKQVIRCIEIIRKTEKCPLHAFTVIIYVLRCSMELEMFILQSEG